MQFPTYPAIIAVTLIFSSHIGGKHVKVPQLICNKYNLDLHKCRKKWYSYAFAHQRRMVTNNY